MTRSEEDTSTSRAWHRGALWESPTASSLVSAMSMELLRFFCQVLTEISLELLDGVAISTIGLADNSFYFTQEQFATGLRSYIRLSFKFLWVTVC